LTETDSNFRQTLFEAVDEGLLMLGESGRNAVYFHLQNLYSLKREDISEKPETFAESLRKLFGIGAEVIEKAILKRLYLKLGLSYEEKKNYSFMACLNDVRHLANQEPKTEVVEIDWSIR
jgi:hypothetical protein